MLLTNDTRGRNIAAVDTIHNYYERMVLEETQRLLADQPTTAELLADIACVALNNLPPRYIRHDVDMAFYLSPRERIEMEDKVSAAVQEAIVFVKQRGARDDSDA